MLYDSNHNFYKYRLSKFSQIPSVESKFDTLEMVYKDFTSLKFLDAEPEKLNHKFTVLNNASTLYNNELILEYKKVHEKEPKDDKSCSLKQKYSPKNSKALDYQPVKLETESLSDESRSNLKQPTQLKQLGLNEISKPLLIKLPRGNSNSLINNAINNLDNGKCKTTVGGNKYDLKNAEKGLLEIVNKKITEKEARVLYNNLIKPNNNALEKSTSMSKDKRNNILNTLSNLESVFTGVYLHYDDKPESKESLAERTNLRRRRSHEIAKKEKRIDPGLFRKYFGYSNPNNM